MTKKKRKLSADEKTEKRRRKLEFMHILLDGKQVRVKRPPTVDGMNFDDFARNHADPLWLHQNELWEYILPENESEEGQAGNKIPPDNWFSES